jgi:tRNA-Thr(GGU) m(6)t(6)A37 methyltransferase TsaA
MEQTIKFIGKNQSELKRIEECPLQENENAPEAVLHIFPEFREGIQDIKPGSEILLLTWLHMADRNVIKCNPRNNPKSPLSGVFSTRSPDRPNPIGINGLIKVSAMDVIDQTPIIDIKPIWNK